MPPKLWIQCKLGEYAEITMGQSPESTHYSSNPEDVPFLQGNRTFGSKYPHFDTYTSKVTKLAVKNSVLLSVRAPVGDVNIAPNDVCIGRGVSGLTSIDVTNEFLYYLLRNLTPVLNQNENGSTFGSINKSDLEFLPILLPDITTRNKIATILSTIDSKIEINREINANLMSILETEYQKIKQNYPDDFILSDLCEIVKNKSSSVNLTYDNYYSTENMLPNKAGVSPASSLPSDERATVCEIGDVLISNIRPYFKKIHYCSKPSGCSADVLCFRSKNETNSPYLFSILYSDGFFDHVVAGSKGTKMPRGDKDQIMSYPISIPSEKELLIFNTIGKYILSMVSKNNTIAKQMMMIRDYLLPKLMSGEIDVSLLDIGD